MAILNKIRQKTLVLILVIAMALFAFVLSGLFDGSASFSDKSQSVVGTVNGKDITREDFTQKVEVAQGRLGPNATNTQVMNRVWDQEVRNAIMETEYDALGITVEQDQMRDLLRTALATNPQFLNEAGLFDENKLNEYIVRLKETSPANYKSWVDYEQQLAANGLQQNYFNLVKAGLTGTLAEGELDHNLEGNKVDIKFVQVPYTSVPDSIVEVSKSDIQKYINDNKKDFEVEESRDIRFVQFEEVASVGDESAIVKELSKFLNGQEVDESGRKDVIEAFANVEDNAEYINLKSDIKFNDRFLFKSALSVQVADSLFNLNEGETYGPYKENGHFKISKFIESKEIADSIQSSHIIVPFIGSRAATQETVITEGQAKKMVDSLLPLVKNNKIKFNEVANEINTDGTKGQDGSIGWIRYSTFNPRAFDPAFAEFLFENKKGSVDIVLSQFGYHIIRIDDKTSVQEGRIIGTIARKIEPSEETSSKIFRDASKFEIDGAKQDFEALATERNYSVKPVNGIKALDESIPGVGNQRSIVRWAFEKDAEVGDIKRFNVSGGYVVAQLVSKNDAGLMSVEDATATVLPIIRKEKKAEIIRDRVSATTLEDLATAESKTIRNASAINMKNPTISGAGREPLVVGTAFGLTEGETSGLIDGEKGVYMVQVTKITPAVQLDNYQAAANRIEQQKSRTVSSKLYNALKASADIEDNRAESQVQ